MISDILGSFLTPLPPIPDFPPISKDFYIGTLRLLKIYPPSLKLDIIYGWPLGRAIHNWKILLGNIVVQGVDF